MSQPTVREVEHEIVVSAPAKVVYDLIADVRKWPQLFPPTVYVDRTALDGTSERIRIWATANGEAKTWTSLRTLDAAALRIGFRQEVSQPPVATMGGAWHVEPRSATESRVRLTHDYRAVGDDPESLAWIDRAVDRNSVSELAALKKNAELAAGGDRLLLSFEDAVEVEGAAKDVYDFINEAGRWAERLPHVAKVSLREDTPGLQLLEMDTRTSDGSVHTTKSVRVCFPHSRIVYKQIVVPALMTLHTGQWLLTGTAGGVLVTSQHTVVLDPANITKILGDGAGVEDARVFVRKALSTNSLTTIGFAKDYAEARRG
ncbi:aromatase/cyclase [Amycolatopsis sp. NPDC059027]|uniref:aromatase/cyclase n=1 Tax=Amycolatopsis sp. NPDC059027 TaxID=3346709 RepID=UPI003671AC6C